jgi:rubrerythrin
MPSANLEEVNVSDETTDRRPDPKPRQHPQLWQAYQWWDELMQMRKRHILRQSSAERGKSNYDAGFEGLYLEAIEPMLTAAAKELQQLGEAVGPIWGWLTAIHGIGPHTAAKLLAQIDDPAKFATISKLWRFAGYAVIDGEIDKPTKGTLLPYNRRLKSELYLMAENFVRHQTPLYSAVYYEEKGRQQGLHPTPICIKCGGIATQRGQSWVCPECKASGRSINFTPLHLHVRALRKTIKVFLSHLWLKWREADGLPISAPYAIAHLPEHTHMIEPYEPGEVS